MNCYKHYEAAATNQCADCGTGLCPSCENIYSVPLCDKCVIDRSTTDQLMLVKNVAIMLVMFAVGVNVGGDGEYGFITGIVFACIPWGWSALNAITPAMFITLPIAGWLIFFLIKATLSAAIGLVMAPFKIHRAIQSFKNAKTSREFASKAMSAPMHYPKDQPADGTVTMTAEEVTEMTRILEEADMGANV